MLMFIVCLSAVWENVKPSLVCEASSYRDTDASRIATPLSGNGQDTPEGWRNQEDTELENGQCINRRG